MEPRVAHRERPVALGRRLPWAAFLAEPDPASAEWAAAIYARLWLLSAGPRVSPAGGDAGRRLEAAGVTGEWPRLQGLRDLGLGVGSPAARLLLVGERESLWALRPFFGPCGPLLFRGLRLLGHDELTWYLTNAQRPGTTAPRDLAPLVAALAPAHVVAVGKTAHAVLAAQGVPHVAAPHPSPWCRFRAREGPLAYADALARAGVPPGPYRAEGGPLGAAPWPAAALLAAARLPASLHARPDPAERVAPPREARKARPTRGRRDQVRSDIAAARRAQVAELALDRVAVREISARLGVSLATVETDIHAVRDEWVRRQREAVDSLQAQDLERLERDEASLRSHLAALAPGDHEDRQRYHLLLLKVMQRRARLCGLDAPIRLETHVYKETLQVQALLGDPEACRLLAGLAARCPPRAPFPGSPGGRVHAGETGLPAAPGPA